MLPIYNPDAPKKAANLSINSDLLKKAKDLEINLSAALEQSLIEKIRIKQRDNWLAENRDAISAYNDLVETNGTFSDGIRSF
jgi:antitoxin CcdA